MHRILLVCSWLGWVANAVPCHAQGFQDWHWSFDQPNYVVGPSDSIVLNATIFVRPESPGPLIGPMSVSFNGSLFSLYDLEVNWDISFTEANIAPGESLRFTFGTLTPRSPIPPGTYQNYPDQPLIESLSLATRHVPDQPLVIQVIPEPSTLHFTGGALLALLAKPLWRTRVKLRRHSD